MIKKSENLGVKSTTEQFRDVPNTVKMVANTFETVGDMKGKINIPSGYQSRYLAARFPLAP